MSINDLIEKFNCSREYQSKGIFSSLFIIENQLKTSFDKCDSFITLKQFMLLVMVEESNEPLTFTKLGTLLGCSRQNIKKLATSLEKNGFVQIQKSKKDIRAAVVIPTEKFYNYAGKIHASHLRKLNILFRGYTDEELSIFYKLLMKLYEGTENLENEILNETN